LIKPLGSQGKTHVNRDVPMSEVKSAVANDGIYHRAGRRFDTLEGLQFVNHCGFELPPKSRVQDIV
jgi:hypothetical protein